MNPVTNLVAASVSSREHVEMSFLNILKQDADGFRQLILVYIVWLSLDSASSQCCAIQRIPAMKNQVEPTRYF